MAGEVYSAHVQAAMQITIKALEIGKIYHQSTTEKNAEEIAKFYKIVHKAIDEATSGEY